MPETNPLTEDDLKKMNESLRQLDITDSIIKRSKLAGIDVSRQEQEAKTAREKLTKLKTAFFPNR